MIEGKVDSGPRPVLTVPPVALRPGISFCRVGDRNVFLDLVADRYFCLSPAGESVFQRLVASEALYSRDMATLDHLTAHGPLAWGSDFDPAVPRACPDIDRPGASLLDDTARPAAWREIGGAALALGAARLRLRVQGLNATIMRIRRGRARIATTPERDRQRIVAAAFSSLRLIATETDNCLIRSIAFAERLIGIGQMPTLVIAVKLQPFAAHAWVQSEEWLVNDRYDLVRDYTPILIV